MNNKNNIYLALGSVVLIGVYLWMMPKPQPAPPPPAPAAVSQEAKPATPTAPSTAPAPAPQAPTSQPVAERRTFQVENRDLKLTFRVEDGALVQAHWLKDGTAFFPAHEMKDGREVSRAFAGLGRALSTRFEGEPTLVTVPGGRTLTFQTAAGDRLQYRLPDQGHVLDMTWTSPRGAQLALLSKPTQEADTHGLGRIFSLTDKTIEAYSARDMVVDPWFGAIKDLPQATSRLGMDAGIMPGTAQTVHYFTAIWDLQQAPQRDTTTQPGFHAASVSGRLYLGPKQQTALSAFGEPFLQVVDFGMFGLIAKGMFKVLHLMNQVIPNWGWTIVIFSLVLRFALWGLNTKQTVSMMRMKDLEPHQKALQAKYEKFGNDMTKKAEMQKELMAFYKKNGYNPMGSCLPMLLQMPIFMALWSMLQNVFELHKAPFHGWIQDLSTKDPLYILPVLLAGSMFAQSKMSPPVGDEAQRKMMMYMMPAMMLFMFANMPAGLNLYYLIFNLVGLFQTWVVMRNYKPQPVIL